MCQKVNKVRYIESKETHTCLFSRLQSIVINSCVAVRYYLRSVSEDDAFHFQKRDIQLLKAYMRAIRSANPNLQNLEESIEYNEILE